jgi:hypothetical protein
LKKFVRRLTSEGDWARPKASGIARLACALALSLLGTGCGSRSPLETSETSPEKPPAKDGGESGARWFIPLRQNPGVDLQELSLGADANGNAYVAVNFDALIESPFDFGGSVSCAEGEFTRAVVAKFDPDGRRLWARCLTATLLDPSQSAGIKVGTLAVGAAGDVALTGRFQGAVSFESTPTVAKDQSEFLLVLDPAGATRFVT